MSVQGWIVLAAAASALLFFGRNFLKNLANRGQDAGCGCSEGNACCKSRRKA